MEKPAFFLPRDSMKSTGSASHILKHVSRHIVRSVPTPVGSAARVISVTANDKGPKGARAILASFFYVLGTDSTLRYLPAFFTSRGLIERLMTISEVC